MKYLDYEYMVDQALLNVVRNAFEQVSKKGLKADHHFYLTFLTQFPGTSLPPYLVEQYPEEITIVLQHEFWNLEVKEESFSVDISFGDRQETITVPFKAIVHISDPSVNFELEFNPTISEVTPLPKTSSSAPREKNISSEKGEIISLDQFRKK